MATTLRRLALILLLSVLLGGIAFAQEGEAPAAPKPTFGLGLGIGVATFNEPTGSVTYQSLSLSPDLGFGKFGIGLAVTLNYRFTDNGNGFEVRLADWWPQAPDLVTFKNVAAIYLPKFKYIRWGEKGDPLFVKLGSIDDATLGNGFIVGNYANTLFLPSDRHFGLNFDMDGSLFGFPYVGLETMTGDLAQFDVIGGRLYVRPLVGTSIPIVKNLEIGATAAVDRKPYLYNELKAAAGKPPADVAFGGDVRLPVLYIENVFSLITFGDVASTPKGVSERAWGGMIGLGGKLFSFLTYGAQLRVLGDDFIPVYFDATYDLLRDVKHDLVSATGFMEASAGMMASLGTSFLDDKIVFNVSLDAPFAQMITDPADPRAIATNPHLRGVFTIGEGIIPGISLDASYDKKGITTWADLIDPLNAAIQAKLNYKSGPAVLSFVYKVRYEPTATPDPWVVTSGLESSIQLF